MIITIGDNGEYSIKSLVKNCRENDKAGQIKAEAIDSVARYLTYTTVFKCTEKLQTINLVLRRPDIMRKLIIK
ncbi:hypothetical protein [Halalkalibaculum roseum]|uniref:hypothetical protein n=1 Tax=Halalkalibaculum roseum TaxID=2709311 RepID=UPI0013EB72C3|nr:hypothetical protein [Halalkalibaculum roseum]